MRNAQRTTMTENYLILHKEVDKLKCDLESLKTRLHSNDETIWEMFSAIISTLNKNNMIVSLPVQAKYDPCQRKLND